MQKCEKDGVQQNRQPDTILFEPVAHYISPTKQFLEHRLNRIAEKEKCQPQQVWPLESRQHMVTAKQCDDAPDEAEHEQTEK